MNMVVNKFRPLIKVGIILLITISLITSSLLPTVTLASDVQKYHFPNSTIEKESQDEHMFSVELDVLTSAMAIMGFTKGNRKTYIMVSESPDGHTSYSFNTPNIAAYIYNCIGRLFGGGWNGTMYDYKTMQPNRDNSPKTALQKYSYDLPTPIYLGEYPYSQYDFNDLTSGFFGIGVGVVVTLSVATGGLYAGIAAIGTSIVNKLKKAITGEGVEITFEAKEIKTVTYNTLDYTDVSVSSNINLDLNRFSIWIEQNWETVKYSAANGWDNFLSLFGNHKKLEIDGKDIFADDFIVPKGKTVGPADDQMHGNEVLNKIIEKAGDSTPVVLNALIEVGTGMGGGAQPPYDYILRDMPYDLNTMSKGSQEYMNFVADPRVLDFQRHSGPLGVIGLTLTEIAHGMNCSWLLQPTKSLCETADKMNSICNLKFFSDNNIDLFYGWKGAVGEILLIFIALVGIAIILKSTVSFIRNKGGRGSAGSVVGRCVIAVLLLALAAGLLVNPENTGRGITEVATSILSIGEKATEAIPGFSDLCTPDADGADKASMRYWVTYFNVWSKYAINTSLSDTNNKFNPSEGGNEYGYGYDKSPATLANNYPMNYWNVALLEELSTNDFFNANRTIDHFIAPKITKTGSTAFTVENNKRWTGKYPYSVAPFAGILMAIAIFLATLMKFLCFIELALDIALLFIRIVSGSFNGTARIKEHLKDLGQDFVRVFAYEVLITFIVSFSFIGNNGADILLALLMLGIICGLIWWLLMSPNGTKSVLRPAMFKIFQKIIQKATMLAKKGVSDAKMALKAARGNYAGAAKEAKNRIDLEKEDNAQKKSKNQKHDKKMDDGSEGEERKSNSKFAKAKEFANNTKSKATSVKNKAVAAKNKAVSAKNKVKSGVNTAQKAASKLKNIRLPK